MNRITDTPCRRCLHRLEDHDCNDPNGDGSIGKCLHGHDAHPMIQKACDCPGFLDPEWAEFVGGPADGALLMIPILPDLVEGKTTKNREVAQMETEDGHLYERCSVTGARPFKTENGNWRFTYVRPEDVDTEDGPPIESSYDYKPETGQITPDEDDETPE